MNENPRGKEGIVVPYEAMRDNPAVASQLQELVRRYGKDLSAHLPPQ